MAYEITQQDASLILTLTGTVDLSETSEIKDAIRDEPKFGYDVLEVDGADLDYIDSSAVALLLFIKRVVEEQGMLFVINRLSSAAGKVIQLAGLDGMLQARYSQQENSVVQPQEQGLVIADEGGLSDMSLDDWFNESLADEK